MRFLRFLALPILATLGLAVITTAPGGHAQAAGVMTNCSNYNLSVNRAAAACFQYDGIVASIQVKVVCSGAPGTWHYGMRVYGAFEESSYTCPAGQTRTNQGVQFYY